MPKKQRAVGAGELPIGGDSGRQRTENLNSLVRYFRFVNSLGFLVTSFFFDSKDFQLDATTGESRCGVSPAGWYTGVIRLGLGLSNILIKMMRVRAAVQLSWIM